MIRIRVKTIVAALMIAVVSLGAAAPAMAASDAGSRPAPRAILKAIL